MPDGLPKVIVARRRKPWWRSKLIWLNSLVLSLAVAESQLNVLQPMLPVNVYAVIAFALPIVNVWLRSISSAALTVRATNEEPPHA